VLDAVVPVHGSTGTGLSGDVDVLVRPEDLHIAVQPGGNGIVTDRTFLGSVTRVTVRLSGDAPVKVDRATAEAADMLPGASVEVSLPGTPVLITERR
jgi:ABC-type Fe3+/spermidine/putrescine transport system ATPase subunit